MPVAVFLPSVNASPPSILTQFYEGYLPFDKSGDWFYQTCEVFALLQVCALLVAVVVVFPRSYGRDADTFGTTNYTPSQFGALWLVLSSLALAALLHPNLNGNFFTDTAWTFALYLEAVAVMPQLFMFQRSQRSREEKEVEFFTANFAFCIALGRLFQFCFWVSSYHELNNKYAAHFGSKYPGHFVVLSQVRCAWWPWRPRGGRRVAKRSVPALTVPSCAPRHQLFPSHHLPGRSSTFSSWETTATITCLRRAVVNLSYYRWQRFKSRAAVGKLKLLLLRSRLQLGLGLELNHGGCVQVLRQGLSVAGCVEEIERWRRTGYR